MVEINLDGGGVFLAYTWFLPKLFNFPCRSWLVLVQVFLIISLISSSHQTFFIFDYMSTYGHTVDIAFKKSESRIFYYGDIETSTKKRKQDCHLANKALTIYVVYH